MVDIFTMCPKPYFNFRHLPAEGLKLTIKDTQKRELMNDKGELKSKPVVYFSDDPRGWVLNETAIKQLAGAWGKETETWAGRAVVLYADKTNFKGDIVGCIRARLES